MLQQLEQERLLIAKLKMELKKNWNYRQKFLKKKTKTLLFF